MSEPQAWGIVVPKFEWLIGLLMGNAPVRTWHVTPNRHMARVEEESGKVRWFLNVKGEPVEVRSI